MVSKSSRRASSIKNHSPPFLFQLRETLNGKHLRVFSEKERIGTDGLSDLILIYHLLQFDIDIPLQSPIGGSYFGAQGILHPGHAPGHRGVAETDAV